MRKVAHCEVALECMMALLEQLLADNAVPSVIRQKRSIACMVKLWCLLQQQ